MGRGKKRERERERKFPSMLAHKYIVDHYGPIEDYWEEIRKDSDIMLLLAEEYDPEEKVTFK